MKILCIGDSLTEGDYGIKGMSCIANIHEKNYPYFLSLMTGSEVTNFGYCGYTSILELEVYKQKNMSSKGYDIAIIMLGTNGRMGNNDVEGEKAFDDLIQLVRKQEPNIHIYVCGCPHVTSDPNYSNCGFAGRVAIANEFIHKYVKEHAEVTYIDTDICPYFTKETEFIMQPNDGLHFGEIGYYCLAKYIKDNIKELM